jgi:hypothetical protein
MCPGNENASEWPPELDAVVAAPDNHRVLFEDEQMRVLEVKVRAGELEKLHHHRWPSVMVIDSLPNYVNYDKDGNQIMPAVPRAVHPEMPVIVRLPPQAAHFVHNIDSRPLHAIRIEYKNPGGT